MLGGELCRLIVLLSVSPLPLVQEAASTLNAFFVVHQITRISTTHLETHNTWLDQIWKPFIGHIGAKLGKTTEAERWKYPDYRIKLQKHWFVAKISLVRSSGFLEELFKCHVCI